MEESISITMLNDFIFCPISIYFHMLYAQTNKSVFEKTPQIEGSFVHRKVDNGEYSLNKNILQGVDVYCEKYNLKGKIDTFNLKTGELTERKKLIKTIYDGYVFQLYAQYFSLIEMGYTVKKLSLYSYDDNKRYFVATPEQDKEMFQKFEKVIDDINCFDSDKFVQTNSEKCANCIYEPFCDRQVF